jgi:hypothetical protein
VVCLRAWEPDQTTGLRAVRAKAGLSRNDLPAMLRRPMNRDGHRWSSVFWAIEYLTRHAPVGSDRAIRLIALVRANWRRIADPGAVEKSWPGIGPDGAAAESMTFPRPSVKEIERLRAAPALPHITHPE